MADKETSIALDFQAPDEGQYGEFLQMMQTEAADYLEKTLEMMRMTWEAFSSLVRTVGQVYVICQEQAPVGYMWIEQREKTLHLHGLFIKSECQGKGYGKAVLQTLVEAYRGQVEAIELGVHQRNQKARRLYEKVGFVTVKQMPELGFEIMQLPIGK